MKLIAILGSSYCGSTYTSLVLGSLKEVFNVGEFHAWVDTHDKLHHNGFCSICYFLGKKCPIFTEENRERIKLESCYADFLKIVGKNIIVASDKLSTTYSKRSLNIDIQPLIIFRSPESLIYSFSKHELASKNSINFVENKLNDIEYVYKHAEDFSKKQKYEPLYMDFEFFLLNKEKVLIELCKKLELNYNKEALNYEKFEHHCIAGNNHALYNIIKNNITIKDNERILKNLDIIPQQYKIKLNASTLLKSRSHLFNERYSRMVEKFSKNYNL